MKKWQIDEPVPGEAEALRADTGLPELICSILTARGIKTRDAADSFFNNEELSDPFDIKDMDKAVRAVSDAVESGAHITIYGDYDCDGITSTYMLYNYLEALGANVSWYIPDREEGYGLNPEAVKRMKERGTELVITVDNGISAVSEAELIYELGMKLVVTDHHQPPEKLPRAEAVIDPHRADDSSEYKELAGCGVVLKLIAAMEGDTEGMLEQYADMAAIGTVGDIVRLDGENRIIVRHGLRSMKHTENMGLMQLLKQCGADDDTILTTSFLGFSVCPRINAASRLDTPAAAMELLLCTDMASAQAKARALSELNDSRQRRGTEIFSEIKESLKNDSALLCRPILIADGENWPHGIIGITSSKLLRDLGKPNIIITREGEFSRGSARSTEELPLYLLLRSCSQLLERQGGHIKAAGFTIRTENIEAFRRAVYKYCDENIHTDTCETLKADMELSPEALTLENARLISNLEPFGEGNREPLFYLPSCTIRSKKSVKDGKYVSFVFEYGGKEFRGISFNMSFDAFGYEPGDIVDLLVNISENEYAEKVSLSIKVTDIRLSGIDLKKYFAASKAYDDYRCGKTDKRLLCRMEPTQDELRMAYDILRKTTMLSRAAAFSVKAGINYCKFRIILDIFDEFALTKTDILDDKVTLLPAKGKADLKTSKVLASLRQSAM